MEDFKQVAVRQVNFMRWYKEFGEEGVQFLQVNYNHPDGHTVKIDLDVKHNEGTAAFVESIAALNGLVAVDGGSRVWGEWHTGPETYKLQGWEVDTAAQLPESIADDGSIAVEGEDG